MVAALMFFLIFVSGEAILDLESVGIALPAVACIKVTRFDMGLSYAT